MTTKTNSTKPAKQSGGKPSREAAQPTYQALKTELDTVMAELQREDLDVDVALIHYQRGLELVQQLEQYLNSAEHSVRELKATFASTSLD